MSYGFVVIGTTVRREVSTRFKQDNILEASRSIVPRHNAGITSPSKLIRRMLKPAKWKEERGRPWKPPVWFIASDAGSDRVVPSIPFRTRSCVSRNLAGVNTLASRRGSFRRRSFGGKAAQVAQTDDACFCHGRVRGWVRANVYKVLRSCVLFDRVLERGKREDSWRGSRFISSRQALELLTLATYWTSWLHMSRLTRAPT